jgi:DNA-binding transcriptional regulator YdaS (Cro superfamily)
MESQPTPLDALKRAIRVLGSQQALGELCGRAQATVNDWVNKIGRLPPEHVLAVEAKTGVSRHDLRPDIYPRDYAPAPSGGASGQEGIAA